MATPTTLPSSFTAGSVLTAAAMNNLRGAFRVLQVSSMTYSTQTLNNTTTYGTTGLTLAITPSATSSKILVVANVNGVVKGAEDAANAVNLRVTRGGTGVYDIGPTNNTGSALLLVVSASLIYLDSPSTTSATTYAIEQKNSRAGSSTGVQYNNVASSLTLFEISA